MTSQAVADPYWSRKTDEWEAIRRQDPVVWAAESGKEFECGLTAESVKLFERNGFHHAGNLFSEIETEQLRDEANRLASEISRPRPGVVIEPGGDVVRSLFQIHRTNDIFRTVARDPRLVDVARQLLGGDVYVYQSRINFKPSFDGREFFWHSDFETWHVEDGMPRMRAVSVSVSLTDNNEFNGPLMVVPQSHWTYVRCVGATPANHHEQSLKKQEYGVPSREAMRLLVDCGGIRAPKGPPGSALFFECNLMHGSAGNLSPYPRTNLFIVYNSVENVAVDPYGDRPPRPGYLAEREVEPITSGKGSQRADEVPSQ